MSFPPGCFRLFEDFARERGIVSAIIMYLGYDCAADPTQRAEAIETLKILETMARFEREKLEKW